jgi:tetratricopeptide (TPR) repeat protein
MRNGTGTASAMRAIPTHLENALALRTAGRLAEALDVLARAGETSSKLATVRGEIEFALGRFSDAALTYFTVVVAEPENSNAHYNLALCLQRAERWDAAFDAFSRALRLDPQRPEARLGAGTCLLHLNRVEEAFASFTESDSGADERPALFGQAVALQLLQRFDEARNVYEMLLASNFNSDEVLSNLIAMGIETHDVERIRDYSMRLLTMRPNSMTALQGLATVALQNSDAEAAGSYCDRILELAPDCLEAWHNFRIAMDHWPPQPDRPDITVLLGRK